MGKVVAYPIVLHMQLCPGTEGKDDCGAYLRKCTNCGHVGCNNEMCPNLGFRASGECIKCGSKGTTKTI